MVKSQIHAGGRGKAGGIKLVHNQNELIKEANNMFGKTLITHQTGPAGKKIKRLYFFIKFIAINSLFYFYFQI